jgi:hypothetical protein
MRLDGRTLLKSGGTLSFHFSSSDVRRAAVSRGESRDKGLMLYSCRDISPRIRPRLRG